MRYIDQDIKSRGGTLAGFRHLVGWESPPESKEAICLMNVGGHGFHSTMNILLIIYSSRDIILKAHAYVPALGYPLLLCIMWAHMQFSSSGR